MKTNTIFEGAATALITPMNKDGVDYPALKKLIEWQIEEGIDALVICGTTGEGSTMTDAEHKEVLRFSLEVAAGRIPMIAGTGSNDTAYAVSRVFLVISTTATLYKALHKDGRNHISEVVRLYFYVNP